MKVKADEYFNNGIFELARCGKIVSLRNVADETTRQQIKNNLKNSYAEVVSKINGLVDVIKNKVSRCNPLNLMNYSAGIFMMNSINLMSEIQVTSENIPLMRLTEYLQSILVSTPNLYEDEDKDEDQSELYFSITEDVKELHILLHQFNMSVYFHLAEMHLDWDDSLLMSIVELQHLYLVRGNRYQFIEYEYYNKLLSKHNDIFVKLFDVTADNIVDGINKLQHSISLEKSDYINAFGRFLETVDQDASDSELEQCISNNSNVISDFFKYVIGNSSYDVMAVTGWTEEFVKALSYGINEDQSFFSLSEYAGWPNIDLPIQKRPFIKINEKYYCFDYYSFVDNFYRSIQKAVTRLDSTYKWSNIQQDASEIMVESIFQQILPGCITYRGNYYPINGSFKNAAENDLLVLYCNILIIVEVKAGSFVYTSPCTDFEAHIRSYKNLIEKADVQCKRTLDYFNASSNHIIPIYNKDNSLKENIDISKVSDIFMMSVTVDNINDVAARAEKMCYLNVSGDVVSLSVDDLMIYREYFKSPLQFIHFLYQRKKAVKNERLSLNDELDHLGMYITHNWYNNQTNMFDENSKINFYGYREELDKYFSSLYLPEKDRHWKKPLPYIPDMILKIINFIEETKVDNRVEIAKYLLDFSSETRKQLSDQIEFVLERQLQTKRMASFTACGDKDAFRYTCFVNQPTVEALSDADKRRYVLASLLWNENSEHMMIDLYFDKGKNITNIIFRTYTTSDVVIFEREELIKLGEYLAKRRVETYKISSKNKIGRNQLCPCGSGKKYKKCCGKGH